MKHFFYKLIPPRPDFHLHQSENERAIMQQHGAYWAGLAADKKAIIYGPVFHKEGVFGIAVIASESEEEAKNIANNDPAILSKIHTYELSPMHVA
ncbi:MAG: YciI family protein [Ginsengibacter sp.]